MTPKTLLIIAHHAEAEAFRNTNTPHLVTGYSKIRATMNITKALAENTYEHILAYGTAGRINPHLDTKTIYQISQATQWDALRKGLLKPPSTLPDHPTATIATGDNFVNDETTKQQLTTIGVDLVDMETYAYFYVAKKFQTPITVFKAISDDADENSDTEWDEQAPTLSEKLHQHYQQNRHLFP